MKRLFYISLTLLATLACNKADPTSEDDIYKPGQMIVRVSPELASTLERYTGAGGIVIIQAVEPLKEAHRELSIQSMTRLFAPAGKFEERSRREGLHLWYQFSYDLDIPPSRAEKILKGCHGIMETEHEPINLLKTGPVEYVSPLGVPRLDSAPYDDPLLYRQWHYFNRGTEGGSVSGCDINVFPVWKNHTPARNDVIVCVVDGGVDFTHEDLEDNMWHNPDKEGPEQYGYNFCNNSYLVTPDVHGTHVAGTIAAVNNNGIGVCGIAGGDHERGIPGVRIMSCQIFSADLAVNGAAAIKWGADHGAVICQNSWGFSDLDTTPGSVKAAVDYFVKYAGIDSDGTQTGPMAGGLVVFAAGNDFRAASSSEYDGILSVTSVGADFIKADYSNWGPFADLAAPGGDSVNHVLSTLPGNKYGWSSGTSMACPHVSGTAALVVSICGGPGFTSRELRQRLIGSATDISSSNPGFYLGHGLVNAAGAVSWSGQ